MKFFDPRKKLTKTISLIGLALIVLLHCYHFFIIEKYTDYPWWRSNGNDGDGGFTGSTIGVLNGTELIFVMHPAATLYMTNGIAYRVLSLFDDDHKQLFQLHTIDSVDQASKILDIGVKTGRVMALVTGMGLIVLFYFVVFGFTKSWLLSFLFSAVLGLSQLFSIYTIWIRPENLSLCFVFLSMIMGLKSFEINNKNFGFVFQASIGIGFCWGLAILSKIQVLPIVVFFALFYLSQHVICLRKKYLDTLPDWSSWLPLVMTVVNTAIFPWWMIRRPHFITAKFLAGLDKNSFQKTIYGTAPDHFHWPVILFALILFLLSSIPLILRQNTGLRFKRKYLLNGSTVINSLWLGLTLSLYSVLAPISTNFSQYAANSNNLIYSVLTNIFSGAYLKKPIAFSEAFQQVMTLQKSTFTIEKIHMFPLALVIGSLSLLRLILGPKEKKLSFAWTIAFLTTATALDFACAFRTTKSSFIFHYYAIYGLSMYLMGMAIWCQHEFDIKEKWLAVRRGKTIIKWVIIIILCQFIGHHVKWYMRKPIKTGVTHQGVLFAYFNSMKMGSTYWQQVDANIRNKYLNEKK